MQPDIEESAPEEASPASAAPVIYAYVSENGDHLPGIPARDLVEEDLEGLDLDQLEESGIYEKKVSSLG